MKTHSVPGYTFKDFTHLACKGYGMQEKYHSDITPKKKKLFIASLLNLNIWGVGMKITMLILRIQLRADFCST